MCVKMSPCFMLSPVLPNCVHYKKLSQGLILYKFLPVGVACSKIYLSCRPQLPPSLLNIGQWCSKPIAEDKVPLGSVHMVCTVLNYPLQFRYVLSSPM